ncbi:MAG: metallophosphoesterase family protein [Butyrivibrio sp.]|nr:metallophosphoesterase family protein [Butyrivibrio sp.]
MIYYIADCHFFHASLNEKMDMRGFSSAEEMNEYMISKWNDKVTASDTVIILGDLSLGKVEETNELVKRLKGKLCLIKGNHDKYIDSPAFDKERFEWICDYKEIADSQKKIVLCHYPILFYNGQYRLKKNGEQKTYMLYGHVHETRDEVLIRRFKEEVRNTSFLTIYGEQESTIPCNLINCFCKRSDYIPLSINEWIELEKKPQE